MTHSMLTLKWHGLGYTPVIIGPQGRILTTILAWSISEKRAGKSDSTLYSQAQAVKRFADYWEHFHGKVAFEDLYGAFFKSLVNGEAALGWFRVGLETAITCLRYINRFSTWAAEQKGQRDPNPLVEEREGWAKTLARIRPQKQTNMLSHLVRATRAGQGIAEHRQIDPARTSLRMSASTGGQDHKAMLWDDYITLIRNENSMRDLLLWLMLGAGGLRISEAAHLLVQDVTSTVNNQARVLLADPRYGEITVPTGKGETKILTREVYLRDSFGLTTRDQLKRGSTLYAGWKGMRAHDGKKKTSDIIWLHPHFGELAHAAHAIYLRQRRITDPRHPYYFVNLEYNVGNPLTISNAKGLIRDACARLNILSADSLHTLRHFFGDSLHNRGHLELDRVQVAIRHKDSRSTEIYAKPSVEYVRECMENIRSLRPQ